MQVTVDDLVLKGKFADGGRGPVEYDCWGIATEVFRRYGIEVPDYKIGCNETNLVSKKMNEERMFWVRCEGARPAPSLIVFADRGLCCHCGVYLGNGRFIHASEKTGVAVCPVDHVFWRSRIEGFYIPRWAYVENYCSPQPGPAGKS